MTESSKEQSIKYDKEISDMKFDLDTKQSELADRLKQVDELTQQLNNVTNISHKLDEMRKENCTLQNRCKDLELENSNLKDNTQHLNEYMCQSNKIEELERENRKQKTEIDYLK